MSRHVFRQDDLMVSVETSPAVIAFDDILAKAKVIEDNDENMAPWEQCGCEHEAVEIHKLPEQADYRKMQGYCRTWDRGERFVIVFKGDDNYSYYRQHGASKQVAAEMAALDRRRLIAQIVAWYNDGWQWYGVRCEFAALGDEYTDSCWGIDSAEYAEEMRYDVAFEVAAKLEAAGYTVTDKPNRFDAGYCRRAKIERLTRQRTLTCWAA